MAPEELGLGNSKQPRRWNRRNHRSHTIRRWNRKIRESRSIHGNRSILASPETLATHRIRGSRSNPTNRSIRGSYSFHPMSRKIHGAVQPVLNLQPIG